MPKSTPQQSISQLDKFKQAASDLGCDDDELRFKERLGKLAKQRPKPQNEPIR